MLKFAFLIEALRSIQKIINYARLGRVLTPEEENKQKIWRIVVSALIFTAAVQVINPSQTKESLKKIVWSYLSGLLFAYTYENSHLFGEIVKIFAAARALQFIQKKYLKPQADLSVNKIFEVVILAPLVEELFFRGIILPGIKVFQDIKNDLLKKEKLTENEERDQKIFRIYLSALIFAAAHLTNPHARTFQALIQFSWTYLGGVAYAYLTEKYQTLSVSILSHGFNNSIAVATQLFPELKYTVLLIAGLFANETAAYFLGAGKDMLENRKFFISDIGLGFTRFNKALVLAGMLFNLSINPRFLKENYVKQIGLEAYKITHAIYDRIR